jgi:hypothetical protein
MLTAIDLDNNSRAKAHEIEDAAIAGRLSPEMIASSSTGPKINPQFHFLWRH